MALTKWVQRWADNPPDQDFDLLRFEALLPWYCKEVGIACKGVV